MEVFAVTESLDEPLVAGQVRHDAHLDLGVVGREKRLEAFTRVEGAADLAAGLGARRNVLQVRVGRGKAPGSRDILRKSRVDTPVFGHGFSQRFDDLAQFRDVTVFEERLQEGVASLRVKIRERFGVSRMTRLVCGSAASRAGQTARFEAASVSRD